MTQQKKRWLSWAGKVRCEDKGDFITFDVPHKSPSGSVFYYQ
jgi:hypothetical protein